MKIKKTKIKIRPLLKQVVELSELEKMGKVKKIKNGRANLVKLI